MSEALKQILADAEALAADPSFPETEAALKALAARPSLAAAIDLAAKVEADPALVKLLSDLTPARGQILARLAAVAAWVRSLVPHSPPAA